MKFSKDGAIFGLISIENSILEPYCTLHLFYLKNCKEPHNLRSKRRYYFKVWSNQEIA